MSGSSISSLVYTETFSLIVSISDKLYSEMWKSRHTLDAFNYTNKIDRLMSHDDSTNRWRVPLSRWSFFAVPEFQEIKRFLLERTDIGLDVALHERSPPFINNAACGNEYLRYPKPKYKNRWDFQYFKLFGIAYGTRNIQSYQWALWTKWFYKIYSGRFWHTIKVFLAWRIKLFHNHNDITVRFLHTNLRQWEKWRRFSSKEERASYSEGREEERRARPGIKMIKHRTMASTWQII